MPKNPLPLTLRGRGFVMYLRLRECEGMEADHHSLVNGGESPEEAESISRKLLSLRVDEMMPRRVAQKSKTC